MAAKDKGARTPGGRMITIEVNENGEALYDVQEIRKMRLTVDDNAEFLVKWRGYKKPTWEPLDNLDASNPMMVEFMRKEAASGKKPRVYTPRKSKGPSTPLRAAAGSAKNTPTKPSTPNHRPVRLQMKTIDTREREAALARARREQAEENEEKEENEGEEKEKEEKEEKEEEKKEEEKEEKKGEEKNGEEKKEKEEEDKKKGEARVVVNAPWVSGARTVFMRPRLVGEKKGEEKGEARVDEYAPRISTRIVYKRPREGEEEQEVVQVQKKPRQDVKVEKKVEENKSTKCSIM